MNGNFYPNPTFPTTMNPNQPNNMQTNYISPPANMEMNPAEVLPLEQSYLENILRLNKGRKVTMFFSFPDSIEWRDRIFKGIIEEAGRDHVIVSNPENGEWYLLPMIYLNYVNFNEEIKYSHDYSEKTF